MGTSIQDMHITLLPGAGGAAEFWHPVGALLPPEWEKSYLSWPGLGNEPHDPTVKNFDDLVRLVAQRIKGPTAIIAQSMGGIVGVRLALEHPQHITHLILIATSGGIDVSSLGAVDWRSAYLSNFPKSQTWITTDKPDCSAAISNIKCPTLLIWGDSDAISPPSVGKALAALIKGSKLYMVEGGNHELARERAGEVAPVIIDHIKGT
jgi:pimeloyl-ACP methyl ester carboxylesterase